MRPIDRFALTASVIIAMPSTWWEGFSCLTCVLCDVQVRLLDVTKPDRVKTLDTYQLPAGAGAHVVKFDKNTWTAAVATYLLDIPGRYRLLTKCVLELTGGHCAATAFVKNKQRCSSSALHAPVAAPSLADGLQQPPCPPV